MAVKAPKAPPIPKPPSPSSVAPGSRGPKRIKQTPKQPTREDFDNSSFKKQYSRSTYPEYLVNWALSIKLKMKFGIDYVYQYDLGQEFTGGLGANVDFVCLNRFPPLALPTQGLYYHPLYGPKGQYDLSQFSRIITRKGWSLIPLDEDDLERDAEYTVKLAVVNGIDISRYRGRY